ncbi:polymeric immunoglobulin receptor [Amia ocellicauda]|uniref:polymeric immunoglobulin receptor n=1 Tax=Amia ocellicauda TaxID=2972642 RepID=UPI003464CF92
MRAAIRTGSEGGREGVQAPAAESSLHRTTGRNEKEEVEEREAAAAASLRLPLRRRTDTTASADLSSPLAMQLLIIMAILSDVHSGSIWGPEQVSSVIHGTVSVLCGYDEAYRQHMKYWCKGQFQSACTTLAKTDGSVTDGRVSLSEDKSRRTLSVTMRDLRPEDEGWYWCGILRPGSDDGAAVYVNINRDASTPDLQDPGNVTGQLSAETTIRCSYSSYYETHTKYWCKGNRRRNCSIVVSTDSPQTRDRTSIRDDPTHRQFTVTVHDLRAEDEGWYWCGIKRTFHFSDKLVPVFLTVNSGGSADMKTTAKSATQPGSTEALDTTTARGDPTETRAGPTETRAGPTETRAYLPGGTAAPTSSTKGSSVGVWVWSVLRWVLFCVMLLCPVALTCWEMGPQRSPTPTG